MFLSGFRMFEELDVRLRRGGGGPFCGRLAKALTSESPRWQFSIFCAPN